MKELIKVTTNDQGQQLVSGRELHEVLGIKTPFKQWIDRMVAYGFKENMDFTTINIFVRRENSNLGNNKVDYILTLDMAKHIAMVQRTEIGMTVRNYFIECEKRVLEFTKKDKLRLQLFSNDALLITQAHNELVRLEVEEATTPLIEKIEADQPKVTYHDQVLHPEKLLTISAVAKDLGMTAVELNKHLHKLGIQFKVDRTWVLYALYQHLVPTHFDYEISPYGQTLKVTELGRKWIIDQLKTANII